MRLAATADALWARFDCVAPDVIATLTQYNDRVCDEDAVEVFVRPAQSDWLYEFQLSPHGVVRDLRVLHSGEPGQRFDDSWRCVGLHTHSQFILDGSTLRGWIAVLGIPWSTVGLQSGRGGRIGLFRIDRAAGTEYSALRASARLPVDFHDPQLLRDLLFVDSGP